MKTREQIILTDRANAFAAAESTDEEANTLIGDLLAEIDSCVDEIDRLEDEVSDLESDKRDMQETIDEHEEEPMNPFSKLDIRFDFDKMTLSQQDKIEYFFNNLL